MDDNRLESPDEQIRELQNTIIQLTQKNKSLRGDVEILEEYFNQSRTDFHYALFINIAVDIIGITVLCFWLASYTGTCKI